LYPWGTKIFEVQNAEMGYCTPKWGTVGHPVVNTKNPENSYFQCGISTGEFIIKVIMESLTDTPYALTWLLFVYPSRVYMTEFYLNTWSGKRLANILLFF
jgi:hypothetical protein